MILCSNHSWEPARLARRSPGPFKPGTPKKSEKSPKGCPEASQRVRPGVRKESKKSPKLRFWTLFGLRGALFDSSGAPRPGTPFRTLLGFRARRARETSVPGRGVPKTIPRPKRNRIELNRATLRKGTSGMECSRWLGHFKAKDSPLNLFLAISSYHFAPDLGVLNPKHLSRLLLGDHLGRCTSEFEIGSSQTWLFQTWLFAIFTRKRSFALLCAVLRTCVCALLRSFALLFGSLLSENSRRLWLFPGSVREPKKTGATN